MRGILRATLLVLTLTSPSAAQEAPLPAGAEILILGTYHMASPGRDVHNMEVDDILSERRQDEISELLEVLRRFRPTKIAVEAAVTSGRIRERYASYRAGDYTLSRNEIDQVGIRLAADLGHAEVYAVDEDGEFPFYRVQNYAKANELEAQFDSIQAILGAGVERQSAFLREHTVLETLALMNSDSASAAGVAGYYAYVPFGEPYEYAGPDLIARWFERNIRIYHNIRALVESPDDRILVVYGAGHLGWLRQNVRDDPTVRLTTLADLLIEPAR